MHPFPSSAARALVFLLVLAVRPADAAVGVHVDGVDGALRENVELRLTIRAHARDKDLDQGLVEAMHRDAPDEIREALQPYGYYNPTIETELSGKAPDWNARYHVEAGPQTTVRVVDLQLEGEGAMLLQPVRVAIIRTLQPGYPLSHSDYEDAKRKLASTAYAAGFLDARFTHAELRVYADENQADIVLHYDTGTRFYFGPVTIEQDILDPDFLQRYVPIRSGEVFDPQRLLDTQFALGDLGYFASLDILPQRDPETDPDVPILIETEPRARTRYNVGLGYGTDTGARMTLGTEVRRLNRRGHTFNAETRLSEIKNSATGEYRIPLGERPGESIGLAGELATEKLDSGNSRKWGLELSLSRIPGRWKRRIYIGYTHEESELGDTLQTSDLLTPGLSLNRADLDNPIYTRRGWSAFMDVHGAARGVLANTSFVRTHLILKGVLPVGERARALARYEFGANIVEEFGELPASQRFFAGGDQSVRGYKYQSLGPRDASGDVIGGKFLTTASIELERQLHRNWGVAVFGDVGGADDDPSPKLYRGIGVGARYRAPVGSVQLDLAHPLDDPDGGIRIHLGVRVGL
ncbi:MAG: autotransporter assembly complex protein TamA [Nevskiales bacterium]|nr:autotransporter assembly complex protein TamA [Nevskiales bacterium]